MSRVTNKQNPTIFLILLLLVSIFTFVFVLYRKNYPQGQQIKISEKINKSSVNPTSSPKEKITSQTSPEGAFILLLETTETLAGEINYTLSIKEENSTIKKTIFSGTIDKQTKIEIPFNTWSPDNKYFFIKQQTGTSQKNLVFKASGEKFTESSFLNINDYYIENEIPYTFNETTGWAAPNLLVITTKKINTNEEGPSYWFNVANQTLIQLSTRF